MGIDPRAYSSERIPLPDVEWYPLPYISRTSLKMVLNPLPVPESCSHCGPDSPVFLVNNEEIYGRSFGDWPFAYLCPNCERYVGLHPGTDIPLGTLADRSTRDARKKHKKVFHEMASAMKYTRRQAYQALADEMNIPVEQCHWGWFNEKQCEEAGNICNKILDSANGARRKR